MSETTDFLGLKRTELEAGEESVDIIDEDAESYTELLKKEMKPPLPVPSGETSKPTVRVTPLALVSYAKGEGSDSDTDESDREEEFDLTKLYQRRAKIIETGENLQSAGTSPGSVEDADIDLEDDASQESKQGNRSYTDDVKLPPEPEGRCSRSLQQKIARMLERKHIGNLSLNEHVQKKKDFRNPSIYEKLVGYCSIDEYGTNYPRSLFNPTSWGPESYYDALSKAQKEAHDKKEKEKQKRGHVEFIKATKKLPSSGMAAAASDEKKISKWDSKPASVAKSGEVPVKKLKPSS